MRKIIPFLALLFSGSIAFSQKPRIEILHTGNKVSLRGLSVVTDNIIWVSGSGGMVGRSMNAGKTWKWMQVKGFEKTDFRDIEAFDANTAIIMGISEPAYILKTKDAGQSWEIVYENKSPGMFLDAMDFANTQDGIVVGDPVNGRIFMARTKDNGETWQESVSDTVLARVDSGEAFFASSGSNIRLLSDKDYRLVSGGRSARLFTRNSITPLDLMQGKESTGANAIDSYEDGVPDHKGKRMIIVGGDFMADSLKEGNCVYTTNYGKTWMKPKVPPHGYRSSVEYLSSKRILACGLNGVDYTEDGGRSWRWISKEGFHVCKIARIGTAIYLSGANGKIARLNWN